MYHTALAHSHTSVAAGSGDFASHPQACRAGTRQCGVRVAACRRKLQYPSPGYDCFFYFTVYRSRIELSFLQNSGSSEIGEKLKPSSNRWVTSHPPVQEGACTRCPCLSGSLSSPNTFGSSWAVLNLSEPWEKPLPGSESGCPAEPLSEPAPLEQRHR